MKHLVELPRGVRGIDSSGRLFYWVIIALMMTTMDVTCEGGFIPQTLGLREDIVAEVQTNAALAGYYPQEVMIYDRPWVPNPGTELVIKYLDDDIVVADRQQEVADDLFEMAWNACVDRPGEVDQIWVGVTCTANPYFKFGHECAVGYKIGHPP